MPEKTRAELILMWRCGFRGTAFVGLLDPPGYVAVPSPSVVHRAGRSTVVVGHEKHHRNGVSHGAQFP
jgi:hypothetical protein